VKYALLLGGLLLAGCPKKSDTATKPASPDDAGRLVPAPGDALAAVTLPPAPPLPEVPAGLPPRPADATITPDAVALGELLFFEPRLATTGKLACASCHDPAHGFAGAGIARTASGKENLRRAPALVNLAWVQAFGWDGRYGSLPEHLGAHVRGQLGDDLASAVARIAEVPTYRAHFARLGGAPSGDLAMAALAAYTSTRYAGDAPWDRVERAPDVPAELKAGYQLFAGKAQCGVCHAPPLYTDQQFHRLGLIASRDEGRGRIDPAHKGAFRTPTLRGAAARTAFFHDGSATSLDAAIDFHLAGGTGQGADPSIIDPALEKIALTPQERAQLGAFVRALTVTDAPPPRTPVLP